MTGEMAAVTSAPVGGCLEDSEAAAPTEPAVWVIVLLVVAVLVLDLWLWRAKHRTISQWAKRVLAARRWLQVVVFGGLVLIGWHIVWGFPW